MDVADIEAMEGHLVSMPTSRLGVARLAVLLRLRDLDDDRDAFEFLASKLQGLSHRFFVLELNITDAVKKLAICGLTPAENMNVPFGSKADTVLHNLGLYDLANFLEKLPEL